MRERNNEKRYKNIIADFKRSFPGSEKEVFLYRAPARVNLIGEHTDYNNFPVLPLAIDREITICASPRKDNKVILKNRNSCFADREFEVDFQIAPYPRGDWGNYSKAAFQALQDYLRIQKGEKKLLSGMEALIEGDIPASSGLSSSSALVVASAVVINDFNKLNLDKLSLAELLARGEKYVGTEGGGMDQAASLCGKKRAALKIDFFPLRIEYIPFPEDYTIVVSNSLVDAKKSASANSAYNQRVIECRLGTALVGRFLEDKYKVECPINLLGDLKKSKFSDLLKDTDKMLDEIFPRDDFRLGETGSMLKMEQGELRKRYLKLKGGSYFNSPPSGFKIKRRLRHVLGEGERVEKSAQCLKNQDMEELGHLMYQSHRSCAEDYEISCPELNQLVEIARQNGAVGARLTGAGFGGCTVNLVQSCRVEQFKRSMIDQFYRDYLKKEEDFSACLFSCRPSSGAERVV